MAEGCEQQASSTSNTKTAEKTIDDFLSDDGKFSYMRLCSIELCSLYSAKRERAFVKKLVCDLVRNVGLPREAQNNLVGCLLLDLDAELNDFDEDAPKSTSLIIKTLKDECQKQQNLVVIPKDLILFALKSEKYDARLRVLIYSVAVKLNISPDNVADLEDELVGQLHAKKESKEESEENEKRKEEESSRKFRRGLMIGLGAIGGGALIGLTGGLAAPLIAAGVGSFVSGGTAVLLSIKGVAIITSLFGAAGAGLTGQKLSRRLGDIEQFEFEKMSKGDHLHVVIAISGWLNEEENAFEGAPSGFIEPWKNMKLGREQYCLKWESKYLLELGSAISSFITTSAMSVAAEEAIKHTVIQGLVSAVAWPLTILKFGYIIDNPWGVCASRSAEVGKHLANVLMDKQHGNRPVTLVGFSFGARVLFHCLKMMSTMKGSEGIIQDAIMIGGPITGEPEDWKGLEKVVSGRVVNGYCKKDWLLKFVYRTASAQVKVAGLSPVMWKNRRMFNVNLTSLVNRHGDYSKPEIMEEILDAVSMGGVCPLDVSPTDIEEHSSISNESVADSGIASSCDSVAAEAPTGRSEPDAKSEEVRLAMEELHKRVERALAEERVERESENKEEELTNKSGKDDEEVTHEATKPQERSTPSEQLEQNGTILSSKDNGLSQDPNKEVEKDSEKIPSEASQPQEESMPSESLEQNGTTLLSKDKGLSEDPNKEVEKHSEKIPSEASQPQEESMPSESLEQNGTTLLSKDKGLSEDPNKEVEKHSEKIPSEASQPQEELMPSDRLEENGTTLSTKNKGLPEDSSKEVKKDSVEISCEVSHPKDQSSPSDKLEQNGATLSSKDKGLPGDPNIDIEKDAEEVPCETSQPKDQSTPSNRLEENDTTLSENRGSPEDPNKEVKKDSEKTIPCEEESQEESTSSGSLEQNGATLSSNNEGLPGDLNKVIEKDSSDSEEIPQKQ